jgi:hypothetical protein
MAQPIWVGSLHVELQAERKGDGLGAKKPRCFRSRPSCRAPGRPLHDCRYRRSLRPSCFVRQPCSRRWPPSTARDRFEFDLWSRLQPVGRHGPRGEESPGSRARLRVRVQTQVRADLLDQWRLQDRNDDVGLPESGRSRVTADGRPATHRYRARTITTRTSRSFGALNRQLPMRYFPTPKPPDPSLPHGAWLASNPWAKPRPPEHPLWRRDAGRIGAGAGDRGAVGGAAPFAVQRPTPFSAAAMPSHSVAATGSPQTSTVAGVPPCTRVAASPRA